MAAYATEALVDAIEREPSHSDSTVANDRAGTVPVLWHFTVSHFNEKARWALDFKHVPHVRRALLPGFHFIKVLRMTGQTAVPVLVLDGRAIHDSTRIIAALERAFPEPALYPCDDAERRRALALEDYFDEEIGPAVRVMLAHAQFTDDPARTAAVFTVGMRSASRRVLRIVAPLFRPLYRARYRIDAATAESARTKILAAFDRLERELQPSGYLVGTRFSVADLTAAALLYPLVQPAEYPYPWPRPLPGWLEEYRAPLVGRGAFQWLEQMYRRHRGTSAEVAA